MTDLFQIVREDKQVKKKNEVVCLFCPLVRNVLQGLPKLWTPAVHHEVLAGSIGGKLQAMSLCLL